MNWTRGRGAHAARLGLGLALAALAAGCGTVGQKREFGAISFRPTEHFRVQFLLPEDVVERPIAVQSLLLLPPVGFEEEAHSRMLMLAVWQELQQSLPGIVRRPRHRHAGSGRRT